MINRDPDFWDAVASHPDVAPYVFMGRKGASLAGLVQADGCLPLASENGGLLFVQMDLVGLVRELHTMYRPEGWGREVASHAPGFMNEAFKVCSLITTHEQEGRKQTRPPLSHGWKAAGDYKDCGLPYKLRLWILPKEAWYASAVGRRFKTCQ